MRSNADDVDSYLALVPIERRAVLSRLRDSCRDLLPGFEESVGYGMPAYSRDGSTEIGWASQKRYISLYVLRGDVLWTVIAGSLRTSASARDASGTVIPRTSTSPLSDRYFLPSQRAAGPSAERPSPPASGPPLSRRAAAVGGWRRDGPFGAAHHELRLRPVTDRA